MQVCRSGDNDFYYKWEIKPELDNFCDPGNPEVVWKERVGHMSSCRLLIYSTVTLETPYPTWLSVRRR